MEFHQLTYFLAAAQTQNFRKAAELCLVAQSALSRQVAALEKRTGGHTFHTKQKTRHIDPSGPGICFLCQKRHGTVARGPAIPRRIARRSARHNSPWLHSNRSQPLSCRPSLPLFINNTRIYN